MGKDWLPDFDIIPNAKSNGGTYVTDPSVPWRFTGHSTEVVPSSIGGAVAMASNHDNPPHLWAWPERNWKCQTVRLDRSAFALLHRAGTPETNKMKAIQCEVIGHAATMGDKPDSFWDWLGREILAPVIAAGYPINLNLIAPTTGNNGYGLNGAVRMSRTAWRNFGGLCVHANVPDNEHWDMGKANLQRMAAAALGNEDDMFEDSDRALLKAATLNAALLAQALVPRKPQNVMLTGEQIGEIVPSGTPGSEVAGDLWRWGVESILRLRDISPTKIAEAVVAILPINQGGVAPTLAEIQAVVEVAIRAEIDKELGFLKPGK